MLSGALAVEDVFHSLAEYLFFGPTFLGVPGILIRFLDESVLHFLACAWLFSYTLGHSLDEPVALEWVLWKLPSSHFKEVRLIVFGVQLLILLKLSLALGFGLRYVSLLICPVFLVG